MAAAKPILFAPGPVPWLKPGVLVGGAVPLAAIAAGVARGTLGANPIAEALNELGLCALVLLVASLACTPLKVVTGWTWPIRVRKTLGVYAFFYACVHFVTYAAIDQALDVRSILADIAKRPFILVGFSAFVILIPLAATSTSGMLKRMGAARWKRLHRLSYLAGVLGVVHFVMRVKKDVTEPAVYGAILGLLFAVRVGAFLRERAAKRAGG
jgi:sulfoxide reductase heme-binding subunit YedZ